MRGLENSADIEKIEAMLFEIRVSFSFIPFKAHHILCTQFVSTVKPPFLLFRNVFRHLVQFPGLLTGRKPAPIFKRDELSLRQASPAHTLQPCFPQKPQG